MEWSLCNQLLHHLETLHTCCGYNENLYKEFLRQLRPCEPSHFWSFFLHNQLLQQFLWMFLKLCSHIVDILKMCMLVLN